MTFKNQLIFHFSRKYEFKSGLLWQCSVSSTSNKLKNEYFRKVRIFGKVNGIGSSWRLGADFSANYLFGVFYFIQLNGIGFHHFEYSLWYRTSGVCVVVSLRSDTSDGMLYAPAEYEATVFLTIERNARHCQRKWVKYYIVFYLPRAEPEEMVSFQSCCNIRSSQSAYTCIFNVFSVTVHIVQRTRLLMTVLDIWTRLERNKIRWWYSG